MKIIDNKVAAVSTAVVALWVAPVAAQEIPGPDLDALVARVQQQEEKAAQSQGLEEITVTGRFISSSQELINERLTDAFATDLLGAETIARLGDSTVAAALRRVPGLTLLAEHAEPRPNSVAGPDAQRHPAQRVPDLDRRVTACPEIVVRQPACQFRWWCGRYSHEGNPGRAYVHL